MPKNSWNDYSTTAASNTDVHSVSIAEGMAPSDVNNAMRELMVDVANFDQGNVTLTSALAIASGGTGATSAAAARTALGITDAGGAIAGVLQTNANFVDQCLLGPALDGRPWNGLWNKASVFSSLMLATIEDEGSNTEINIWDLTEASGSAISTTPLATVDLSADATPTSIAACMGYLIVGSEDGISICDPHSGAWAERTSGWPRTLSTSTTPALTNNDIQDVAAGLSDQPVYDPRTGGPMPTFVASYGSGSDQNVGLWDDGTVTSSGGTAFAGGNVAIMNGRATVMDAVTRVLRCKPLSLKDIVSGDYMMRTDSSYPQGFPGITAMDAKAGLHAMASTSGFSLAISKDNDHTKSLGSQVTRTYNTGYMVGDIRGAWLANSKTVDRSIKGNTLTENGTVTEGAVASGAELNGYSGWTTSNYMSRAHDTDLDFGTSSFCCMAWVKTTSMSSDYDVICSNEDPSAGTSRQFTLRWEADGALGFAIGDGAATKLADSAEAFDDGAWHFVVGVKVGTTDCLIYVDGVLSNAVGSGLSNTLTDSNAVFAIGRELPGSGRPNANGATTLVRVSATVPTATQIRQMYDAEKGMFVASAECLLQSGSTDAVLDVDVDPLTGKVLVTQTDAITVFDGLVVDSKPTVNSGSSEKGKLWGSGRVEINSANCYATMPSTDQRQVNEMVRGLANDLPRGPDLSKAAAWLELNGTGTISITSSYNIKSVTDSNTGLYEIFFATPFKSQTYVAVGSGGQTNNDYMVAFYKQTATDSRKSIEFSSTKASTATLVDNNQLWCAFFGELANE